MSGSFLRNGGRRAQQLLLHSHSSSSSSSSSSKFKVSSFPSSSHFSPAHSSFFSSSSSSSSSRNGFIGWYLRMIETRPILTKSLTAGAIFATADVSSQAAIGKVEILLTEYWRRGFGASAFSGLYWYNLMITLDPSCSLDLIRTLRMAGYGMMISGPSLHLWFNFVSRILPKRDILTTFKKMFLGQAVYGPIMTAVFFSFNAALQGETNAEIFARLKRDFIPTMKSCLVYWPICDFITFKFVPVRLQRASSFQSLETTLLKSSPTWNNDMEMQPLVSNSFSYLWTIYITYMASLQKASVEQITDVS